MKTVTILQDFVGYPGGKKRAFKAGETVEVPNDFADLIVEKKHAREAAKEEPAPAPRKEAAPREPR